MLSLLLQKPHIRLSQCYLWAISKQHLHWSPVNSSQFWWDCSFWFWFRWIFIRYMGGSCLREVWWSRWFRKGQGFWFRHRYYFLGYMAGNHLWWIQCPGWWGVCKTPMNRSVQPSQQFWKQATWSSYFWGLQEEFHLQTPPKLRKKWCWGFRKILRELQTIEEKIGKISCRKWNPRSPWSPRPLLATWHRR